MSKKYIFAQTIFTHFLGQYHWALKRWRWLIDLIGEYRYGSLVENRDAAYLTAMDF